ncbi:hypothetical protein LIER_41534 [Lithospermum erythrorhizon]|uniref:Uncharacterized protein n=1 Tax=Lithospermum erythrorhizon TaxID=34254 RepID=A0AAV3RE17_LITER
MRIMSAFFLVISDNIFFAAILLLATNLHLAFSSLEFRDTFSVETAATFLGTLLFPTLDLFSFSFSLPLAFLLLVITVAISSSSDPYSASTTLSPCCSCSGSHSS